MPGAVLFRRLAVACLTVVALCGLTSCQADAGTFRVGALFEWSRDPRPTVLMTAPAVQLQPACVGCATLTQAIPSASYYLAPAPTMMAPYYQPQPFYAAPQALYAQPMATVTFAPVQVFQTPPPMPYVVQQPAPQPVRLQPMAQPAALPPDRLWLLRVDGDGTPSVIGPVRQQ